MKSYAHCRWLRRWNRGSRWSGGRGDDIWVDLEPARAIRYRFGKLLREGRRIRLFDRQAFHGRLKKIVGEDCLEQVP